MCALGLNRASAYGSSSSRKSSNREGASNALAAFARYLPDRADQVVEVVGLHHGGLAALIEKAPRLVARAVAGDEHEPLGELGALLAQLLVEGGAARAPPPRWEAPPPRGRGICRSVTTASNRSLAGPSRSIASSPFSTATTSWPSRSSKRRIACRFTASSSTTRIRSFGSAGVAAVVRANGASTLFGSVTTTSAPPPVRGRSRSVPPDDCASARASANSISPPPALCVNRNGVTRRCSASTESGTPESQSEIASEGPLSLTAI